MTPKGGERQFDKTYAPVLFNIAVEDLESARFLASAKTGRKETVIFLCQQAMEKALKATLCSFGLAVPLVHDLGVLVARMPEDIEPPYGYDLTRYNDYAGILRYEKGHSRISKKDLEAALSVTQEVLDWCRGYCARAG